MIKKIIDPIEIDQFKKTKNRLTSDSRYINRDFLKENHWIAVPLEDGALTYSPGEFFARLSKEARFLGCEVGFAATDEPVEKNHEYYSFSFSCEDLESVLVQRIQWLRFFLYSEPLKFCLLMGFDYALISGPKKFIEAVFGKSVEDLKKEFLEYATNEPNPVAKNLFLNVNQKSSE